MVLNVKAFLEKNGDVKGEIRRFQVPSNGTELYPLLVSKVCEIFQFPENGFRLQWQDSDSDFVTFSTTHELMEAVKHSPDGVLRLFVKPLAEQTKDSAPSENQGTTGGQKTQEEKVFHPGVVCDGCEGSIYGPRYKCVICPDYDLCGACEQKNIHSEHDKFKITHPQNAGGHAGFMPPHFRRWMHRFMKKCQANNGQNPAGAGATAPEAESSAGSSSSQQQQQQGGCPMGGNTQAQDEFLKNLGENISSFLDPFGIDVTYEVQHGEEKKKGQFCGRGRRAGGCRSGPGMWQWGMFGNAGGCTRMPQEPKPGNGQEKEAEKKAAKEAEKQAEQQAEKAAEPMAEKASEEREIPVVMEEDSAQSSPKETPPKEASAPKGSPDDDWTMLNEGETTTDGGEATATGNSQGEGLYPNLKVAQAVEMMKAMGFNDDGGWLTRLLDSTDGDIASALDTLKLGAQQAGRLS